MRVPGFRIGLIVVLAGLLGPGPGEPAPPQSPPKEVPAAKAVKYMGVLTCARCHTRPSEEDVAEGYTKHIRLTEYVTWDKQDKHRLAVEVFKDERTRKMEQILGITAAKDPACMNCHSGCSQGSYAETFDPARGVSCEACHGASSLWLDDHWKPAWRRLTPQQKAERNLVPLDDPATRVRACLSCHLGSAAQKRMVTHAMYAAGHPPLPGFEIETFVELMPPHWDPPADKPREIQQLPGHQPEPMRKTKFLLVGGVVALEEAVRLLADPLPVADGRGPELSLYDCRACHHDLRVPSWRQERGYRVTPGRPTPRSWPMPLARLGLAQAGKDDAAVEAMFRPLYECLGRQPFGRPDELAAAAHEILRQLAPVVAQLRTAKCDKAMAQRLLSELCRIGTVRAPDYDSARQLAWAFRIIYREAGTTGADAQIAPILAAMTQELYLEPAKGQQQKIGDALPAALKAANDYAPSRFQQQLERLRKALRSAL